MTIYEKLQKVQMGLIAPKNQYNEFGNYYYRNCEDILSALKPLLESNKCTVIISDKINCIGNRNYVESTVMFIDIVSSEKIEVTASAMEEESKKKMDGSQVTGSTSSYARKYALNAMFLIDDTKDSDSTNKNGKEDTEVAEKPPIDEIADLSREDKIKRFKSEIARTGKSEKYLLDLYKRSSANFMKNTELEFCIKELMKIPTKKG